MMIFEKFIKFWIYCLFQKVGPFFLPMSDLKNAFFSHFELNFEMAITFYRLEIRKKRKYESFSIFHELFENGYHLSELLK